MIEVGVFEADITPPLGHPLCAGWYPPAHAIEERLRALGVVLVMAGQPPVVLCALDWAELSNGDHLRWRRDLAKSVGTDPDRVAVHCVHAHDTPWPDRDAQDFLDRHGWPGVILQGDWAEQTRGRVAEAARGALERLHPCTSVSAGESKVDRIASNRRIIGEDGTVVAMRFTRT